LSIALAGLAADRADSAGADRLHDALETEKTSSEAEQADAVHDLHAAVAGAASSRVLELVALVLIRLSKLHLAEYFASTAPRQVRAEVLRAHEGIAAAVESGDRELARHRMRRHLDALGALMH